MTTSNDVAPSMGPSGSAPAAAVRPHQPWYKVLYIQVLIAIALGIVGMGRIGRAVAKRAAGFGLNVIYHQRTQLHPDLEKEFNASYVPTLDGLLAAADIVTLHCPHTAESHHMIGAPQLQMMKRDAYLINTARGALVDEKALIHALKEGIIAGAGLDVYEHAPNIPADLRGQPNVLLIPHVASATIESRHEMGERVIINIKMFTDGHRPPDRCPPEAGTPCNPKPQRPNTAMRRTS